MKRVALLIVGLVSLRGQGQPGQPDIFDRLSTLAHSPETPATKFEFSASINVTVEAPDAVRDTLLSAIVSSLRKVDGLSVTTSLSQQNYSADIVVVSLKEPYNVLAASIVISEPALRKIPELRCLDPELKGLTQAGITGLKEGLIFKELNEVMTDPTTNGLASRIASSIDIDVIEHDRDLAYALWSNPAK